MRKASVADNVDRINAAISYRLDVQNGPVTRRNDAAVDGSVGGA